MDFEEIVERIKDILATDGKKNIKDADVARALGIDPNTFYQMKFRGSVPYKEIMDFLVNKKISINLFFYNQSSKSNITSEHRYKTLRMFRAKASLGGGALNNDEDYEEVIVDKKIMNKLTSNAGAMYECDIIDCVGDSMEPHIMEGDLCIIGVGMSFKDGEVYAVNTPDGVVIKECYKQGDELVLVSYNPIYTPVRFWQCECKIIGKFVGIFRGM